MNRKPVKILLTGDFCPINRIEELVLNDDHSSIFNDCIDIFQENDLNIVDLECPLTLAKSARPKTGPHQKAHPDTIAILEHAEFNLVAMANNHIMDYDRQGVKDTLELCRNRNIQTIGIGKTGKEAAQPFSATINGKKICVLNFADNEFLTTPGGDYTCNPIDPVNCFYDLRAARREHDFVIAIIHAGNEFYDLPSPRTKKLYRSVIDMGADAVVSHHTHAYSGYEVYHSKPIFYGLGNFIYDWPGKRDSDWNNGYAVRLEIGERLHFELIPYKQNNEKPGLFRLDKDELKGFNQNIERLNNIIEDDKLLEEEFKSYCESVLSMYDAFIEPYFGRLLTALRKRGFFPKLMSKRKRLLLLNIVRCESHRDVLLRMLKTYE